MNSPFTREEQAFARSVERLAHNAERIATALETIVSKLNEDTNKKLMERLCDTCPNSAGCDNEDKQYCKTYQEVMSNRK